jgi:hypothetical protein
MIKLKTKIQINYQNMKRQKKKRKILMEMFNGISLMLHHLFAVEMRHRMIFIIELIQMIAMTKM